MKFVPINQLDQSNPGTWPIYYKAIIWILLFGGILFAFNHFKLTEMVDMENRNNNTIQEKEKTYRELLQYTVDLDAYKARSEELLDRLESLLTYLPAQNQIATSIEEVNTAAADAGINLSGFKPADKYLPTEYYDIAPIALNTTTYFTNFANFSEGLTNLQRIMNISDFNLVVLKNSSNSRDSSDTWAENAIAVTDTQLQTYIYNGDIEKLRKGELPQSSTAAK
ncbi:type 4a pilus biogenesis protein PilO [Suttonella indologenes]|uniref:Pilus assembly protein, PilO n=1 Tax=Suttonella indologenes TaxID=13276 RepID=A0A380N0J7_9GAMM|nr:type 4a pilus biogenesis protein PilO [Suttonella indologenes]SUO98048.1 Pilus assembly protein, PilO [Suttonella indologenes]